MITARELLQTHFDLVFRGYHPGQVDEFIRRLVSEYETLRQENDGLREQLAQFNTSPAAAQVEATVVPEDTAKANVEAKARLIQLEQYISNAAHKLLAIEQETAEFNRRMRVLLQEHMSLLSEGEQETVDLHELAQSLVAVTDEDASSETNE